MRVKDYQDHISRNTDMVLSLLSTCSNHSVSIKVTITYPVTSASTAILVLFHSTAFSTVMVTFTFKIIRMTGSAVGRILVKIIIKWKAHAIAVTPATTRVYSMIARVVPIRVMTEDTWCPAVC